MKPTVEEAVAAVEEDGWVVLHDVVPPAVLDGIDAALRPLIASHPQGRNDFEGTRTIRVSALLAKGAVFQHIADTDAVVDVVAAVLRDPFQVSIMQAIHILPGETVQGMHTDDLLYPLPLPHRPVVCNTMWAITDFTEENGATRLVPGSHRWTERRTPREDEVVAAEMPRGAVLVWLGNLLHEGGANRTESARTGITMNYNLSWLRQQENQYLAIPRDVVATFSDRLKRLVGYDVHPPFVGNVDGRNPIRAFTEPHLFPR